MFGASHSNVQTSLAVAHGMDIAATIIMNKAAPVVTYLLHDFSAHYMISAIAPRSTGFGSVDYNQVKS